MYATFQNISDLMMHPIIELDLNIAINKAVLQTYESDSINLSYVLTIIV